MSIDVSALKGPLGELMDQCSGPNGEARFEEFKLWLKKVSGLFKHLRDVALGPISEFKAAEKFTKSNSEVKFCDFGGNFKKLFLNLVEAPVSAATVSVSELLNNSLDAPIRTELGDGHVITLGQFYEMLKVLPKDGTWFIAYIVGNDGNVWAVDAGWRSFDEGWSVGADSVDGQDEWRAGSQVLSRKLAA